uniref:SERPIN domain-containing protein n=1 Tax=Syphacia muris TaxID=451379 RepID=A0A0N5AYL5_9BILA
MYEQDTKQHQMSFPYEIVERRLGIEILRYADLGNGSQIFSPFSIAFIMTMLWIASVDETNYEIGELLAPDVPIELYASKIIATSFALFNNHKDPSIRLASRIYLNSIYQPNSTYVEEISKYHNDQLENIDFGEQNITVEAINDWVKDKTNGKIQNIIKDYNFSNERAVLVSGFYYKVSLKCGVLKTDYITASFHPNALETREVLMVSRVCESGYYEDDWIQVLKLKMRTVSTALYMFLPKRRFTLDEFENDMTALKLDILMKSCSRRFVAATFPKFDFNETLHFEKPLMKAGVIEPFVSSAKFPRLSDQNVYVTSTFHETVVEAEEVSPEETSAPVPEYAKEPGFRGDSIFFADHPFLFLIMHEKSVLVMGRYK